MQPTTEVRWIHRLYSATDSARFPDVRDAIVLIGSANRSTNDLYWTDLGQVSGGEIILNDVRQMLVAEPGAASNVWKRLQDERIFFLCAFPAVFFAAFLVPHHPRKKASRGLLGLFKICIWPFWHSGIKLIATVGVFALILRSHWAHFHLQPDFVTPFLALFAENVAELFVGLVNFFRRILRLDHR